MDTRINLKKVNGEIINAELISYFQIVATGKKYVFYSLNEMVENNLVKLYVSEVSDTGTLSEHMLDEEWSSIKNIMKLILTNNANDTIKYLKWEG